MATLIGQIDLLLFVALCATVFAVSLAGARRQITSAVDPLVLLLANVSINVGVVAYFAVKGGVDTGLSLYVMCAWAAFLLPLSITPRRLVPQPALDYTVSAAVLTGLLCLSILLQYVGNAYYLSRIGLGVWLGTVNPDIAKVTTTQGGGGVFRAVTIAAGAVQFPLIAELFVYHGYRRRLVKYVILVMLPSLLLPFSKAGLLMMVFDVGLVIVYARRHRGRLRVSSAVKLLGLIVAAVPAAAVLTNVARRYGTSILNLLLGRAVATGLGTYLYFVQDGHLYISGLTAVSRIRYYFDTLLSMTMLKRWEPLTYVALMTRAVTGSAQAGFGANPYLFLDGHMLFGATGVLYTLGLGLLLRETRSMRGQLVVFFVANKMMEWAIGDPGISQNALVSLAFTSPLLVFCLVVVWASGGRPRRIELAVLRR